MTSARPLAALELIQDNPGITARWLADRPGVTERAARRYVATLREVGLPIESASGPYGGYLVGCGLRLPPLMFTAAEALGLVMAALEGHPRAADPADPVDGALAKIVKVLPEPVAGLGRSVRDVSGQGAADQYRPSPELTTALIESSAAAWRLRLGEGRHALTLQRPAATVKLTNAHLAAEADMRAARCSAQVASWSACCGVSRVERSVRRPGQLDSYKVPFRHASW